MATRRERRKRKQRKKPVAESDEAPSPDKQDSGKSRQGRNILRKLYEDNYRQLLIIPFGILLAAFVIIGIHIASTGDFIDKDVSLKGGLAITVLTKQPIQISELGDSLKSEFPNADIRVREITELGSQVGLIIDASDADQDGLTASLASRIDGFEESNSIENIGPALGESFFRQTMLAILTAFIFMSLVVFYYFRTFIPSMAVVLAAFSDMVVTIAVMNIIGMRLSTAGIAALLMLIGYSVDTDILLSTRVLKRKEGSIMDRIYGALKTGLTMNITTLAAITVALFISQSETITQIMSILLIGLLVDIINTWIQNTGILRMYMEKKG